VLHIDEHDPGCAISIVIVIMTITSTTAATINIITTFWKGRACWPVQSSSCGTAMFRGSLVTGALPVRVSSLLQNPTCGEAGVAFSQGFLPSDRRVAYHGSPVYREPLDVIY
jgi:hypothetical protein